SRALGETMIVAIAAGQQPNLTLNPLESVETITTYIVQVSLGDVPQDSMEYRTIFAAGITLFAFTFLLNNISFWIQKKYQNRYDYQATRLFKDERQALSNLRHWLYCLCFINASCFIN